MDAEPKENSELLTKDHNVELTTSGNPKPATNGVVVSNDAHNAPPDGGIRAYSVLVGSFLTNGLLFGVINSYSAIYAVLEAQLKAEGVENSESKASLVGALAMGITFLLSPVSGVLTALMGLRRTAVLGGSLAALGLLLSSFAVRHVDALCFTYGVLYGLGASLAYTPSLAILGHYFKKYLGLVNGIVTIGSPVFTVFMLPFIKYLITTYGLEWMFRVLAVFTVGIALCGLLFKPIPLIVLEKPVKEGSTLKSLFKTVISVEIWKNMKYRIWALSMPVALFGYLVPYVHMEKFIGLVFVGMDKTYYVNIPLQCMSLTSAIGRLLFGYLGDKPGIDKITLQQISFYVIGTLTIILPFAKSFGMFIAISLGIGLVEGAFIALIGPIAFELCGGAHAAQAIGCMLGLAATPLSLGPSVAGALFKLTGSYTTSFVLAGICPLLGASLMFSIRFYRRTPNPTNDATTNGSTSPTFNDIEKLSVAPSIPNGVNHKQTSL